MKKGNFKYKDGDIYFEIVGEGEPITFIHGFSLDRRMWRNQVKFFKDKFKIIAYDMRGYGLSSIPKRKHSHHDDLAALLRYLKIKKTHLVGLSLGGHVGIDFAVTHNDLLLSLTLIDASIDGFPSTVDWDVKAEEVGIEAGKKNWLNHVVFKPTLSNKRVMREVRKMVSDYSGWQWLNPGFRTKVNPKPIGRLDEIKVPTMIIVGEKDLPYYHEIADVLEKEVPNTRRFTISGAGHLPSLEKPKVFNKKLYDFILSTK